MNANELMLGDWVRFTYPHHETGEPVVRVFKVTQIEAQLGDYYVWSEDGRVCHPEQLQPIPLTPEILEKNGWKHKYYGIYRQTIGETITIDIFPEGCSVEDERGSQCFYRLRYHLPALKFVHELQHALRLCGIEKEIELCNTLTQKN